MKKKPQHKLPFIDKFFLWINIGLCLALLLSYLAPVTDPKKIWVIAFFGLAYPPLLLCNVLMIVYWVLRRSKYVVLPIATILLGYNTLNNNVGFRLSSSVVKPANALRLMTYNVHDFKRLNPQPGDKSTKHDVFKILAEEQPDIICMQEYFSRNRGVFAMTDSIKKIIGAKHYYFEKFYGNDTDGIGIAMFSKLPIIDKGLIQLTELDNSNQCLYIDIKYHDQIVRIYTVHLQSIKFEPVDYRYIDSVAKNYKADYSSTKRLGGKLKKAFIRRSEQVAKIRKHASQCSYPYIIAGDFNDTPTSFAVNQMAKGLKNAFREKGSGLGRTYNGDFPNYQIDYVMASPNFDVAGYRIIEKKLSDHYPVCADLVLK
ncbi:MAG: endonuclease/exonuclease/phosphatase family protein [Bacteroidota bacterium]